jgi:formate dehydrogenase subunit gamma
MSQTAPLPVSHEHIQEIVAQYQHLEGPLLPILHALQDTFGHIPETAAPVITAALNISKAELHGVISFYHDFHDTPVGRHVVKICRAEACQAVGVTAMTETVFRKLGLDWHQTTTNGAVTVEPVYCLGLCACGPAVMVDDRVIGRVDAARLESLLVEAGA